MSRKTPRFISESGGKKHCLLIIGLAVMLSGAVSLQSDSPKPKVSEGAIKAVILAVKDEIYSERYFSSFSDIDYEKIPIYIDPYVRNNLIWTIYKLMPYGEVIRGAYLRKDGQAVLVGDAFNGFPPTNGAATKTVYMNDDDIIKMKTTWLKRYFSIDINPSTKEIQEANRRQELRNDEGKK